MKLLCAEASSHGIPLYLGMGFPRGLLCSTSGKHKDISSEIKMLLQLGSREAKRGDWLGVGEWAALGHKNGQVLRPGTVACR